MVQIPTFGGKKNEQAKKCEQATKTKGVMASGAKGVLLLLLCAAGIYTAYLYQGYLQERM